MDNARDVLLVFCITPCGPCEALQPTLMTLAELYASNSKLKENLTIAKVMYDAKNTPERSIRAFPTIKLFPAASKGASLTFLGPRTLDDLADFIRDNGTHKADLRDSEEEQIQCEEMSAISTKQEECVYDNGKCTATVIVGTESAYSENGRNAAAGENEITGYGDL